MMMVEVADQAVAKVDAPEMALVEVADQAVAKVDASEMRRSNKQIRQ
ncbi:hypothetical protein [Candidatus Epulonipiscium viviparus]|nr:hypothetical protein [Candidatus Epulopiscium viviparus]